MVLGLLWLRSEVGQVIYAMRSRPQSQAQICVKWPEGGERKGSGICSTAAALALRLLDGFLRVMSDLWSAPGLVRLACGLINAP